MLGVKDSHGVLTGGSAKRFIEKLIRVQTGNLNDEDRKEIATIKKRRKESKWQIVWEY